MGQVRCKRAKCEERAVSGPSGASVRQVGQVCGVYCKWVKCFISGCISLNPLPQGLLQNKYSLRETLREAAIQVGHLGQADRQQTGGCKTPDNRSNLPHTEDSLRETFPLGRLGCRLQPTRPTCSTPGPPAAHLP